MKATNNKVLLFRLICFVLLGFLLSSINLAHAQKDVTVRLYDNREMIAGNYTTFCKDGAGFMWIGTDSGLLCFDGNHTDLYRNDELDPHSLSDNKIFSLFCDSGGRLWVGTGSGLNYYDRKTDTFRLVALPGLNLNGFINDITELPDGRLLFLVAGIGFYTLNPASDSLNNVENFTAQRLKLGFNGDNYISALCNLGDKGIVFTTRFGEVYRVSPGGGLKSLVAIDGHLSKIEVESDNTLIIATQYEVFRLYPETGHLERLPIKDGKRIKINNLCSAGGSTCISTSGSGIWEVRAGSDVVEQADHLFSSSLNLETLKVGAAHIDDCGNLWLGCNHKGVGLAPVNKVPFMYKSLNKILQNSDCGEITCIDVVGPYIVAGLNTGRLLVLDSSGSILKVVDTPHHNQVTSVISQSADKALIGLARDGIWSFDLTNMRLDPVVAVDQPYPGVVLSTTADGEVLAAFSEIGVLRYNPATGVNVWYYPQGGSDRLSTSYYSGISATAEGKVWIGGYSGVACYDPLKNDFISIDQTPFVNGVVHAVCDADDGCIMMATGKGLIKYKPEKGVVRKYTVLDGLADNDVRTLMRDGKGGIWIGTLRGLSYMSPGEEKIRSFGSSLGLPQKSYVFSSRYPLSDSLVLGDYEGISIFNPDSVSPSDFGGEIRITGFFLNGNRIIPASTSSANHQVIEGNQYLPSLIHLAYNENSLVLRLSTMDYRDASEMRYEWQIDGEHDKWVTTSLGESFLYLPPLDPGKHTLRFRGWENDVCSDIYELTLDVKAPWYLSDMAYAAYVLIALMMFGLLYKVVKNKREEELYEARIKYFMDISHEIRSPITLLLTPVDTLLKQEQSPETKAQLLTVRRNAQRVLNLADQLLDLRKIEKGKMRLIYTPTDIRAFVEELVEMFRSQAEEKGLKINFSCTKKELWGKVDRNNLDKILVNLISNAVKYTPSGGEVTVELHETKDSFGAPSYTINVIDTGIGLDNKVLSHLFERFYRNRERHHTGIQGFGIGLDLCMRLVELHKGQITGRNREDGVKGSIFTVTLPLHKVSPCIDEDMRRMDNRSVASKTLPGVPYLYPNATARKEEKSPRSSNRFRILVVDDDAELRDYIKENLGSGFKVTTVGNVEDALKLLRDRLPDLIVTDIRMDGLDGLELLKRVKTNIATQHIPVILFSSANGTDERTKGWKRGADGYLAKPFSIDELEGMITGLLSTRSKLKGKFSGSQDNVDKIEAPKVKSMDEELMKRVNKYINDNLSETAMNVDRLSEYVGLSRSQLHRRLKEIIGMSPSDYIRNVKLTKACELLSQGDVDIAQVAYSLGFTAQSHFSTLFKRFTGMTPTEFKTSGKSDIEKGGKIET